MNDLKYTYLTSISMADAKLRKGDSVHILGEMFSAYMKRKDYIESNPRSAARNIFLYVVPDNFSLVNLSCKFIRQPFVHTSNIVTKSGPVLLL